jgi:hypothetical protein
MAGRFAISRYPIAEKLSARKHETAKTRKHVGATGSARAVDELRFRGIVDKSGERHIESRLLTTADKSIGGVRNEMKRYPR